MAKSGVIGSILMLLLPHTMYRSSGNGASFTTVWGYFYIWSQIDFLGVKETKTETFESNWTDKNGVYNSIFGDNYMIGLVALGLIIIALFLSLSNNSKASGLLLIASGVIVLLLRFQVLSDNDSFFIDNNSGFSYYEMPLSFLLGIIWGIRSLKENK